MNPLHLSSCDSAESIHCRTLPHRQTHNFLFFLLISPSCHFYFFGGGGVSGRVIQCRGASALCSVQLRRGRNISNRQLRDVSSLFASPPHGDEKIFLHNCSIIARQPSGTLSQNNPLITAFDSSGARLFSKKRREKRPLVFFLFPPFSWRARFLTPNRPSDSELATRLQSCNNS